MLAKELFVALITCIVFCHGTFDTNVNSRIKRLQEDESILEENAQSNVESKPRNEDLINLRLGDVTRPISQNVPKLSNIKNILTSSIPIPVQLLLGDNNQNQPNELNTKPNNTQDIEESNKNNNIDSNIVPTNIGRLAKKKIAKKINDDSENMEITDISRRSQAPNNLENNNSRNLVLENKLNNRNINTEKIISPENYNKEHLFDEAIIPLLKVLGNSLKMSELDTTNSDNKQQKTLENKIPEEHRLTNNLDDTKDLDNIDVMSAEKVTKILEEQNNLLKEILFKTLNFKNETNVNNEEKDTKKIHLILDINNSDTKENENPSNKLHKQNNFEKILTMILYRSQNNTQQNTEEDKNERNKTRIEEVSNKLRKDTKNQYFYFNDRNRKYIYITNTNRNQPTRRLNNYKTTYNKKQYPITEVDWKRSYDMGSDQKSKKNRIIFVPSHEEVKIDIPSNNNYELYKKFKSSQINQYALHGVHLHHKLTIAKCPYHAFYSRL